MNEERRSGMERRRHPPMTCTVPCEPIDTKLTAIEKCVKTKTPQKLFYWAVGGIAVFCVIVIGGAQWKMVDDIKDISTDVKVMKVTVDSTQQNLSNQIVRSERLFEEYERRLDVLEHKTYRLENGE
jgi:hypothetical protein